MHAFTYVCKYLGSRLFNSVLKVNSVCSYITKYKTQDYRNMHSYLQHDSAVQKDSG